MESAQSDAATTEANSDLDEVARRSAEPIELPYDGDIRSSRIVVQLFAGGWSRAGAGALLVEYHLAASGEKRGAPQVVLLVFGRDSCVADSYAVLLGSVAEWIGAG